MGGEVFFCAVVCAFAEAADTPSPAATSSVRARCVAFRSCIRCFYSVLLIRYC